MTSSTKPEVHDVVHYLQVMTVPWSQVACTENFMKSGPVVFEICRYLSRQTNRHTDTIAILCNRVIMIYAFLSHLIRVCSIDKFVGFAE